MNLFQSILDKAKGGANYLASGKLGSDVYDEFNAQDPTQTMRYKAVQGAANLYTGVAKEAAMGGQRDFEQQISQKRQAFISDMLAKGYDKNAIFEAMDSLQAKGEFDYKPSFMGRVREGLGNRMLETARTTETLSNVENPLQRLGVGTLAYGGDVVATAMEPVASAVSPLVQAGIEKSGLAPTVQNLGQQFQGFKERNPLTGEAVEGVANISQLVPVPLAKPLANVAKQGGKAIVKTAEAVAPKVVQGVKKITPTLPKAEELLVAQLEKTNRMNPTKYMEFEQIAGQRAGKFLADRKITGDAETNVAKLYDNFTKSKAEAEKGLSAIEKTYKPSEVPPAYTDMLTELEKRFTYTKDNANLAKVQEYKTKLENGTLSHNDINGTKRLYEQKVKVNYIKDQNSLEVERATNIDNDVRTWQFDEAEKLGFGNLKEINKETQLNRFLADNIGDKIARGAGLNNISLTDWIIAGQVPATPQAFALLAGKKFAEKAIPKLYQKGLEKIAKMPKKEAPIADIENINKIEAIRKSITPQYDTNRLLVSPRSSSRAPATITPEVTLPKGEKATPTTKSPVIKSDITSKSKIVRPSSVKPSPQVKPVEKVETMTKGEAILYRKNGKIYAKDNQATRDALKRSGIDIEPDGEIKKQLTFYPEDDFRPDVTPKTVKPVEKTMKASEKINGLSEQDALYLYSDQKYKDINKALRSGNESSDMVKLIDSAISKNETDRAIRVYRGVDKNNLKDILKKQENGDVIYSDKAYLSTSMSPKVAKEFSDGFLLEINLPKGTKYAKNPVSEKEMEFILERGKSYKVTSQRKEGEFTILSLDPISSPKPISPQKTSVTQARGPIDPTTGKRKTIVQSPTAYEAGIRRPYTLNGNKPIVKRSADIDSTTHDKFISHLNKKEWWRTAENINANNTRGRFLASSFKEAEFYGRPLDTPFKVNIKNPLVGSEEYIMGKLGMKKPSDNISLQERFKLDEQMAQKALSQGYDSIALLSEKGFNDLKAGKIPRSIELNDLTTVNKQIVKRASDSKGPSMSKGDEALMSEARKEQIKKGKIIGEGSDRKVIDLGNGTVIKIPKNERGIMQMDVNYADLSNKGLIPKVIEKGKGYVIFEKIENGGKLIESMMNEIDATNYDKKKILSILNDYGYKIDSLDGITINELLNKNNWGVKNGKPIIVDEGIFNNERIFNKGKNLSEIEQNIKYIKGKQKEFKDFQKSIK